MFTETLPEIWCGAVDQLPANRDDITPELFAVPSCSISLESRVVYITIHGIIGHRQWLQIAVLLRGATETGAPELVLEISSRAQEARGCGLAFLALESVGLKVSTTAHIESAGAFGAALALASCAGNVFVDKEDRPLVGGLNVASLYGDFDTDSRQLASDAQLILRALASRRAMKLHGESYVGMVTRLVNAGKISADRAQLATDFLNDYEA